MGSVEVRGLKEMRRDMRAMSGAVGREFDREIRLIAKVAQAEAQALAPRRSGKLAESIKPFSTNKGAGIRTPLVYARMHEYGGKVWLRRGLPYAKPAVGANSAPGKYGRLPIRQVPATPGRNGQPRVINEAQYLIKRHPYMRGAALKTAPLVASKVTLMLDRLAVKHGF